MNSNWILEKDRFRFITRIIRSSLRDSILNKNSLSRPEQDLAEEACDEGIVSAERLVSCGSEQCMRRFDEKYTPDRCDCGYEFNGNESVTVQYHSKAYPDQFTPLIEDVVDDYIIQMGEIKSLQKTPVSNLHPNTDNSKYLHFSPYLEIDDEYAVFPGYSDIFIDWYSLPRLIKDPEEVLGDVEDFLETAELGTGSIPSGAVEKTHYTGPGAPGPEYFSKTSWYTLLEKVDSKEANQLSKDRFYVNYNEMFERLGIEFLHTLFPRVQKFHLGGDYKPDGLLHINHARNVETYLIESKCYSNDFNLFKEEDKADRYVDTFIDELHADSTSKFNLTGYIFLATKFNENKLPEDIHSLKKRADGHLQNLDIICINARMMEKCSQRISRLYRQEPSATHRVYAHSDEYQHLIDNLVEHTENNPLDLEVFDDEFIKPVEGWGAKESEPERRIDEKFQPSQTQSSWKQEGKDLREEYILS